MINAPTPSEALSAEVVDHLIKEKLLRPEKRGALLAKIASGHMKEADWKLEIDLAQRKERQ